MNILWFTNTPSLYEQGKHRYHGGGWIESLEEIVRERSEINLAIAFFHPYDNVKKNRNGVTYYPIKRIGSRTNPIAYLIKNWSGKIDNQQDQLEFFKIVEDFKPNIIQVFGTEGPFAMVQEITTVPVIVHLQGLINPYLNTYFPIGYSKYDFIFNGYYFLKNLIGSSPVFSIKRFRAQADREKRLLAKVKFVCGRTAWDRQIIQVLNPETKYFHIDEVLRPVFYTDQVNRRQHNTEKMIILSTLSPTIYKGIDVVLRTAKQLSELARVQFEWRIVGLDDSSELIKTFQKKESISHKSFNIKLLGKMTQDQIVKEMLNADVFVHPSYIDNSPNSVCEAQMLGLPVIACNVGGLESLITHMESGILVPSNGVYELVYYLEILKNNPDLKQHIGNTARKNAMERHDRNKILNKLISVYNEII